MKKLASLLLVFLLAALPALAASSSYTVNGMFTISVPSGYEINTTDRAGGESDGYQFLFYLLSGDCIIDAAVEKLSGDYAGFSTFSASSDEINAYIQAMLNAYADESPVYKGETKNNGGAVPFHVFLFTDETGPYYFAETITNGYSIYFMLYTYEAGGAPSQSDIDALYSVIRSFQPVT